MTKQKNVLTIATGKKIYIDFALNLAHSFLFWHPETSIRFQLVTDQIEQVPNALKNKIEIIEIDSNFYGKGFSTKLFLDQFIQEGQTIFIDSDCLIYGSLDNLFAKFNGHQVSVVGGYINEGEWFGNVKDICRLYNVKKMPKFNGGIYYLEKGTITAKIYHDARQIEKKYDEIGFIRLRNQPNDEVIMALAMEINNQIPIDDDGKIMSDFQACPGPFQLNVIKGIAILSNPPKPSANHQSWYPFEKVHPLVVHFLGDHTSNYPYKIETYRLLKFSSKKLNFITTAIGKLKFEYPSRSIFFLKNLFRPFYRILIGRRKIKQSQRF